VQPSASSAPLAPSPKSNAVNGFAAPGLRAVAHHEDVAAGGNGSIVRVNRWKAKGETDADDVDANLRAPICAGKFWLKGEAMSAAEALRAAHASGVRLTVDGESLVPEVCAHRALIAGSAQS
jgi:hypothetical protein